MKSLSKILLFGIILFVSCQSEKEIKITEDDTTNLDLVDSVVEADTSGQAALFKAKSKTYKLWKTWFDECVRSDTWKKADYLGLGNPNELGNLTDEKKQLSLQEVSKFLNPKELSQINKKVDSLSCKASIESKIDLSTILESDFSIEGIDSGLEAELKSQLKKFTKSTLVINRFERQELIIGELRKVIKHENPNSAKNDFLKDLTNTKNRLLNRVIIVHEFTLDITFGSDFSSELKAKLNKGVVASIPDANGSLNLKLNKDGSLTAKSTASFPVLGQYVKIEDF